jgi:hypothetical protein
MYPANTRTFLRGWPWHRCAQATPPGPRPPVVGASTVALLLVLPGERHVAAPPVVWHGFICSLPDAADGEVPRAHPRRAVRGGMQPRQLPRWIVLTAALPPDFPAFVIKRDVRGPPGCAAATARIAVRGERLTGSAAPRTPARLRNATQDSPWCSFPWDLHCTGLPSSTPARS